VISNDTSLTLGETALLACVGSDADISWSFNGQVISNTSLVTIYEKEVVYGTRVFKQFFLQLCNLMHSNAGDYTCVVTNGRTLVSASTSLTVSGT